MAILVGIDEAGYGPVLGPLVVSMAAFKMPDAALAESMWECLRVSVSKKVAGSNGRIAINDSKKLHTKKSKYAVLQRTILACLAVKNDKKLPYTFEELLLELDGYLADELKKYPWYQSQISECDLEFDEQDVLMAANAFKVNLADNDMQLLELATHPLDVDQYNQQVEAANNKATVLFSLASQYMYQVMKKYGKKENNLQIIIDKHGGRDRYREPLQRTFPKLSLKILKEQDGVSSYQMENETHRVKIHFLVKGDDRHLPIALASMTSKYVRELFMEQVNAYFSKFCPEVKPTAGYYKDGHRFLSEIRPLVDQAARPQHLLVRSR